MEKKSSGKKKERVPPEAAGIQVNFCKNPNCENFGVPASATRRYRKGEEAFSATEISTGIAYTLNAGGKNTPQLLCSLCGEKFAVKSNLGIAEELFRITTYLKPSAEASCSNPACNNHGLGVKGFSALYRRFGKTRSGSQRYVCKACNSTFSVGSSTLRQKKPHKNRQVFALLMNKAPFKRILEVADITAPTLYAKIDFFHQQCLGFAASKERELANAVEGRRLNISVDRQDYGVNWAQREDKRNVILHAIGSADNKSGYVFGMNLNFDPGLDRDTVEAEAFRSGDYEVSGPFRRHARLWLHGDRNAALAEHLARESKRRRSDGTLDGDIWAAYENAVSRDDVEASETKGPTVKLPTKGFQIHSEYTMYAHFQMLQRALAKARKVSFYLDQDSGIRAACLSAFPWGVKEGLVDAFYVRIRKELTVSEKRNALSKSSNEFDRWKEAYPHASDQDIEILMIQHEMSRMKEIGKWNDRWLRHPFPSMSEPEKAVCHLTGRENSNEDDLAWQYYQASLHGIDRFFMQVRRRISLLERPIASASAKRTWYGYSAYNPEMIIKLLDIFRVYYNFVLTGKDHITPAIRLGVTRKASEIEDILYFSYPPPKRPLCYLYKNNYHRGGC